MSFVAIRAKYGAFTKFKLPRPTSANLLKFGALQAVRTSRHGCTCPMDIPVRRYP